MFGPVAVSLPLTLIIKPMTSTGSHFHPRLTCLVDLICQIQSPQSPASLLRKGVLWNKQSSRSVAKSQSLGFPLPGIPASGRPFPPALPCPWSQCPRFPLFLAGSGMMEVELMWLLVFTNSTPSACLSFYTPRSLPLRF